ncbi:hybrid sensor histidine kinase/response regulator [Granulosicoccaceae sp. 1_MG-2023]|nr:hybrid sensor histidine kinase/response regulator [Granulosicoccaceae sp. 1_MG-2023]
MPNLNTMGVMGVVGFPLFYVIWTGLFPQVYDSPWLRGLGFLVSLGFLTHQYWHERFPRFFRVFWLFGSSYGLSFFFVYTLLMNEVGLVWSMSTLAGLMLLVLLVSDWLLMVLIYLSGAGLAFALAYLTGPGPVDVESLYEQIPIFLFAMVTGSVFNHRSGIVRAAKQKAVAAMGASIAHELRTPLLLIETQTREIQNKLQNAASPQVSELSPHVEIIEREHSHASTIIEMLLVGLGSLGDSPRNTSPVTLSELLEEAVRRFPYNGDAGRSRVQLQIREDGQIVASRLLIMHVIFNLMKNAFRAIEDQPDGQIRLTTERDADSGEVLIRIRDNGCGIAPEVLPRIFDDFFTTSGVGRGSGVGLAFCRRVMKQHGAWISCRSEQGRFTEFTLRFPAGVTAVSGGQAKQPEGLLVPGGRALIVDDEEVNRRRLATLLGPRLCCDFADSVAAARAKLSEQRYAVVFCDQHMPGGTGSDLFASLGAEQALPVRVLVTGDPRLQADRLDGVDRVIYKPLDEAQLAALFLAGDDAPAAAAAPVAAKAPAPGSEQRAELFEMAHDICSPLTYLEHLCESMRRSFPVLQRLHSALPPDQRLTDSEFAALMAVPAQFGRVTSLSREKVNQVRRGSGGEEQFPGEMCKLWRGSYLLCRMTLRPTLPRLLKIVDQARLSGMLSQRQLEELRELTSTCVRLHEEALAIVQRERPPAGAARLTGAASAAGAIKG